MRCLAYILGFSVKYIFQLIYTDYENYMHFVGLFDKKKYHFKIFHSETVNTNMKPNWTGMVLKKCPTAMSFTQNGRHD